MSKTTKVTALQTLYVQKRKSLEKREKRYGEKETSALKSGMKEKTEVFGFT